MESREATTSTLVGNICYPLLSAVVNGWKRTSALSVEYHVSLVCMVFAMLRAGAVV